MSPWNQLPMRRSSSFDHRRGTPNTRSLRKLIEGPRGTYQLCDTRARVVVTFVFSSPTHHVEMMVPIARALARRGERVRFVSLAELRGRETPDGKDLPGPIDRVLPPFRKGTSQPTAIGNTGSRKRQLVRAAMWHVAMRPRLRWLLRDADVVVIPNDVAYPYDELVQSLRARKLPFALLQEGIRFVLPREAAGDDDPYGRGNADAVLVWGEAAAEH